MFKYWDISEEGNVHLKRVLILEDQENTLAWLKRIVESCGKVEIYALDNVAEAYKCAMNTTIDLFIVDIILEPSVMRDSSGLKFVDDMRHIDKYLFTPVIFITALEDSRLYTYEELHCYGFIEKPFDEERVKKLVEESLKFPGNDRDDRMIYFRKDGIIFAIGREDIVYAEMVKQKLYLYTDDKELLHIPYMTLRQMIDRMDNPDMVQCRRNAVVNSAFINNIDITNRVIQLKDGYGRVEIGHSYKKYLKAYFKTIN